MDSVRDSGAWVDVALVGEIPSMMVVGSTLQQEEGILPQGKVVQIMIITFYSYYTETPYTQGRVHAM